MRFRLEEVNSSLSVEVDNDIKIFPNPTGHNLNISIDNELNSQLEEVTIHSMDGRLISTKQISGDTSIHMSNLDDGLYYISISLDNVPYRKVFTKTSN